MAKITPSHLVSSISGKLCKKDTTYIGVNKRTGKMYSAGYHGCVQPNSEKQQTVKSSFTRKSQFASVWWKQNRQSSTSVPKVAKAWWHGCLRCRDEGVQVAAQDRQSVQLSALPCHRRPQGHALRQRPHGWRIG